MKLNITFQTMVVRTFLKEYRPLVFWLIWGICMSLWFGLATRNYQTSFAIFMGFGIYLGLVTHFRDNPEMGRVFRPDYEMTYDDLKIYNFDTNAEILYAMGLIDSLKNNPE